MASSKYRLKYCQMIIDHMSQGYSMTSFAAKIGVSRQTIHDWTKAHVDFLDAYTRAQDFCQGHWEDLGRDNVLEKTVHYDKDGNLLKETERLNPQIWALNMKARFGYKEKQEIDLRVDGEIEHNHTVDMNKLREALAADPVLPIEARQVLEGQIKKESGGDD